MLYTPHQPAPFDAECGTFEASAYEGGCSGASMLCGEGAEQGSLFVRCLRAINCKMKSEMRVDAEQDELALFMHQVILPAAPGVSNEGGSSPLLVHLPAVSWPWVPACGSLEPPRRDGENAQKTGENGGNMGEIQPKKCG